MVKYLAVTSYLGRDYYGFERQKKLITVQGSIEKALEYLVGVPTLIKGAGRTDAGVNALGQTFSFSLEKEPSDLETFRYAFNRLLPPDILVKTLVKVPNSFDARHSSCGKKYVYRFHFGEKDPFAITETQIGGKKFDFSLFEKTMSLYKGEHDFSCFTTKKYDKDHFIRDIKTVEFVMKDNHASLTLMANGFMTYMVRILVGVAFKVATGRLDIEEVQKRLSPIKRQIFSFKAPAEGLTLLEVLYETK